MFKPSIADGGVVALNGDDNGRAGGGGSNNSCGGGGRGDGCGGDGDTSKEEGWERLVGGVKREARECSDG